MNLNQVTFIAMLLFTIQNCKKLSDDSDVQNVFGEDDRKALSTSLSGARTLVSISPSGCTGFWISEKTVVTAAHCILSGTQVNPAIRVRNFEGKESTVSVNKKGSGSYDNLGENDYAILAVNDLKTTNWLTTKFGEAKLAMPIALVGFHFDKQTPTISVNCRIQDLVTSRMFLHDCDLTQGASGGPIITMMNNSWTVIGVQSGEKRGTSSTSIKTPNYDPEKANVGVVPQL